MAQAEDLLLNQNENKNNSDIVDQAFGLLIQISSLDPQAPGLSRLFEACLLMQIDIGAASSDVNDNNSNNQDVIQARFGLASLWIDQERYEEASQQLQVIVQQLQQQQSTAEQTDQNNQLLLGKASSLLFRTNAACCHWDTYHEDSIALIQSLHLHNHNSNQNIPVVHPFEALKWPCLSISDATYIASRYAQRAMLEAGVNNNPDTTSTSNQPKPQSKPKPSENIIRVGYISPDFTPTHPLAFLMQHVFRHHNPNQFQIYTYSLASSSNSDDNHQCPEVQAIINGSHVFCTLPSSQSPQQLAQQIQTDQLDILIDLCGYTGTSVLQQILALRPAPIQVSYMGFPGSTGAPYLDYLVVDPVVVPSFLRRHYTERLIYMPHSYFVNSHATCANHTLVKDDNHKHQLRDQYHLPRDAFVFCCHNRPSKIDPITFQSWCKVLTRLTHNNKKAVLWLLRSGPEMETNLRRLAAAQYGVTEDQLVFSDIVPRDEHLTRLGCADLFLDTPAYNAHTLGCDALFAGLPMVTLLMPENNINAEISEEPTTGQQQQQVKINTDKLSSRVGASLVEATGLKEFQEHFICPTYDAYEDLMVKCATDQIWYRSIQAKWDVATRYTSPLFDTSRWVQNLEVALKKIYNDNKDNYGEHGATNNQLDDIRVVDSIAQPYFPSKK